MAEIQTTYRRTLDPFRCGQMANTIPGKCESGVLTIPSTQTTNTTLPFGRACRWTGANQVNTGSARKAIGTLGAAFSSGNTMHLELFPGMPSPSIGTYLTIDSEDDIRVESAATGAGMYTTSGRSSSHNSGALVYVLQGGPTAFAGVAVRDVTIPAANAADTYASADIVAVGTEGDFVVEVDAAVAYGDRVGVYVGTATPADYGKFTKKTDATGTNAVIGIPNASFVSASQDVGGKLCAILRLPKQST